MCFLYGNGFPLSFPTVCGEIIAGSDTIPPSQNTMNRNVRIALVGNKIDLAPTKTADKHYHSSGRSVCHSLHSYTLHDIQCAGIENNGVLCEVRCVCVVSPQLASSSGILYFETSAESGENVQELFETLATEILDQVATT